MPKKNKRRKKGAEEENKQLVLRDDNSRYAKVTRVVGQGRFYVDIFGSNTQEEVLAVLPGRFRKWKKYKNFVSVGTYVLVSIREYEESKVDIIHVYKDDNVRQLRQMGHLEELTDQEDSDNQIMNETESIVEKKIDWEDL
jgi:translation initiation factor 1A